MTARGKPTTAIALATALLAVVAGCGGERMSAEEFVDAVGEEGVRMKLGDELLTDDSGKELYALELEPLPGAGLDTGGGKAHIGGSLAVYDEDEGADRGFETCQVAADLLCYRAANVVIVLEGGGIEAQRLAIAIQKLGD
jgi:hypothetical protein